ncbi:asparaginyl-tRNA synthetase [Lentithecium fluviatile CBS 122367]|uniref:asparagine--tRNA ligase n=1 Tax=Lentithecium fluviatile CBS 122367 TaxID=1168545 RepID=A0A6G1J6A8_9PLEO|nr:asparaginyl-tRNA synthetase [Lentithecium fluviatile CBS 122367]
MSMWQSYWKWAAMRTASRWVLCALPGDLLRLPSGACGERLLIPSTKPMRRLMYRAMGTAVVQHQQEQYKQAQTEPTQHNTPPSALSKNTRLPSFARSDRIDESDGVGPGLAQRWSQLQECTGKLFYRRRQRHRRCCIQASSRIACWPSMSQSLGRRRICRLPLRLPLANHIPALRPQSQWPRRAHSSTHSPPTIATLLRQSQPPLTPQLSVSSGETLTVNGFVRSVRKQKRVAFAAIGDGSSLQTVQAVLTPEQAEGLSTGTAVAVAGRWTPSRGAGQTYELQVDSVRILGGNDATKYQTPEFLRTVPHLRARLPLNSLLLRLRSQVTAQVTNYFANHSFIQTHPPIITSSDCEGASEVFTIAPTSPSPPLAKDAPHQPQQREELFFGSPRYLTVSSQLHLEALAQSVGKVWTLSPTFRAEKSDTARHLSEFYMLEAELAFVDDLASIMDVVEGVLRAVATDLQTSHVGEELLEARSRDHGEDDTTLSDKDLAQRWRGLVDGPWPCITYKDAIGHLTAAVAEGKAHFEFAPGHVEGLQTEHERFLAETLGHGGPIFVTDYPRHMKPFYMAPSSGTSANAHGTPTVACFDLLVPEICELVGGSMREHRLPELLQSMEDHGLKSASHLDPQTPEGSLQWYLDLRRYGSVPHGGFGLGFDRLLCYLSGVANIRDVRAPSEVAKLESASPVHGQLMATHERTAVEEVEHEYNHPTTTGSAFADEVSSYESLPPNFSLSANMLAGAFAGIAEHSVMYPIDLLKTRMQVVNPSPTAMYTGISNAMVTISRVEGFRTLWKGLSSVVLGAGPAHAVYFASYEAAKHALGGNEGGSEEHHPFAAAASGASATIASDALMNPFDVIKQRMQLHGSVYTSVPHCARQVFRNEGLSAFYVSYPTTLCMTVPFTALQFMSYESLSKVMNPTGRYDPYTHCFAGGLAGGVAAGITTPLDVIKTLLQTRGNATDSELRNVSGLWNAAKIIHQRDGYGGFFRGLKPRIITTMPSTAICWQVSPLTFLIS